MARIDDYKNAYKLAAGELAVRNPKDVGQLSRVDHGPAPGGRGFRLEFEFIGRPHVVEMPEVSVSLRDSEEEVPLTEQVLMLHYLNHAKGVPLSGESITYREIPAGEFYYSAFVKRAEAPMLSVFGPNPGLLEKVASLIGGRPVAGPGDAAAVFQALPMIPITLVVWGGDDEFEPSGKILFDKSVSHYLPTEDIAWLSGMVVYRLLKLASQANGG